MRKLCNLSMGDSQDFYEICSNFSSQVAQIFVLLLLKFPFGSCSNILCSCSKFLCKLLKFSWKLLELPWTSVRSFLKLRWEIFRWEVSPTSTEKLPNLLMFIPSKRSHVNKKSNNHETDMRLWTVQNLLNVALQNLSSDDIRWKYSQ